MKKKKKTGGQGRCERRSEVFVKIQKKNQGGGGVTGWGVRVNVNGERRSEAFVKIQKKKYIFFFFGGGGSGPGVLGG